MALAILNITTIGVETSWEATNRGLASLCCIGGNFSHFLPHNKIPAPALGAKLPHAEVGLKLNSVFPVIIHMYIYSLLLYMKILFLLETRSLGRGLFCSSTSSSSRAVWEMVSLVRSCTLYMAKVILKGSAGTVHQCRSFHSPAGAPAPAPVSSSISLMVGERSSQVISSPVSDWRAALTHSASWLQGCLYRQSVVMRSPGARLLNTAHRYCSLPSAPVRQLHPSVRRPCSFAVSRQPDQGSDRFISALHHRINAGLNPWGFVYPYR